MKGKLTLAGMALLCAGALCSCGEEINDRIPNMRVYINLASPGVWERYGVNSWGQSRNFIRATGQPADFSYTESTYTGFGGVMLICGQNPYTAEVGPLAFDLACPVERNPDVRVYIGADWEAVCPDCGSHYNVVERGGVPVSGPAYELGPDYRLRMYQCLPASVQGSAVTSGYIITN